MSMFCNQCEQAANGVGCNISGVCGKKPDVAALQDHLLYGLKSLALYADKLGRNAEIDRFTIEGLFTTVTNVDFDAAPYRRRDQALLRAEREGQSRCRCNHLRPGGRLETG